MFVISSATAERLVKPTPCHGRPRGPDKAVPFWDTAPRVKSRKTAEEEKPQIAARWEELPPAYLRR